MSSPLHLKTIDKFLKSEVFVGDLLQDKHFRPYLYIFSLALSNNTLFTNMIYC
jgi:hypothetical protein